MELESDVMFSTLMSFAIFGSQKWFFSSAESLIALIINKEFMISSPPHEGQYEMGRTWTTSTILVNQSYPAAAHHLALSQLWTLTFFICLGGLCYDKKVNVTCLVRPWGSIRKQILRPWISINLYPYLFHQTFSLYSMLGVCIHMCTKYPEFCSFKGSIKAVI